jgi:NitT/TauT family transport system substrate-binding protein
MAITPTRRRFLTTLSLAGVAGLVGTPRALAAEGALETTNVRLQKGFGICTSPQYIADELLRAEGFTDIRYVEIPAGAVPAAIGRGKLDFTLTYATTLAAAIDRGEPIMVLAGVHVCCFDLLGNEAIRSVTDLKGKTVGVQAPGA